MANILFLLPSRGNAPVGGFKVVYEYANRFHREGYTVKIIYPSLLETERLNTWKRIRRLIKYIKVRLDRDFSCSSWFKLDPGIQEIWVYKLNAKMIGCTDIVFATAVQTALFLMTVSKINITSRFYLIQNYENWIGSEELLLKTWNSNLRKIVIAPWLQRIADDQGQKTVLIENGFDFNYFRLEKIIENRSAFNIAMLFHESELKGCQYAIEALTLLKQRYPKIKCLMFGIFKRPKYLPEWFEYHQRPIQTEHNSIYNEASIFIAPALVEGFALTPAEAMMCGCAVVATNIGGYEVICKDNETALLCTPKNAEGLAINIERLIRDDGLRHRIAKSGNSFIQQFTWERAFSKLLSEVIKDGKNKS